MSEIEIPAPSISAAFAADTERLARKIEQEWPDSPAHQAHAAAMRRSIEGLAPVPVVDGRSLAQQRHDAQMGVSYTDGRVTLPAALQGVLAHDAAGKPPDKDQVAAQLDRIELAYKDAIETAKAVLLSVGSPIKAEQLSAHALAQLGIYANHLKRHAASRPK